jgi:RimJ/RimL family protein N-acetyltransferase
VDDVVSDAVSGVLTRLRPVRRTDLRLLQEWDRSPGSEFEDLAGASPPGVRTTDRLPLPPGSGTLAVTDGDDVLLGSVGWHPVTYGPNAGSRALDIGISLHSSYWGRGHGSRAQRMLAAHLFATTPVHRVQASTDVRNLAEQRALERAGFRREGVLRGAQWRRGAFHDLVSFARLRTDD